MKVEEGPGRERERKTRGKKEREKKKLLYRDALQNDALGTRWHDDGKRGKKIRQTFSKRNQKLLYILILIIKSL